MLPYYIAVAAVYGGLTWAANSILPALVLHVGGDIWSLTRLWATGRPEWQLSTAAPPLVSETGADAAFVLAMAALIVLERGDSRAVPVAPTPGGVQERRWPGRERLTRLSSWFELSPECRARRLAVNAEGSSEVSTGRKRGCGPLQGQRRDLSEVLEGHAPERALQTASFAGCRPMSTRSRVGSRSNSAIAASRSALTNRRRDAPPSCPHGHSGLCARVVVTLLGPRFAAPRA